MRDYKYESSYEYPTRKRLRKAFDQPRYMKSNLGLIIILILVIYLLGFLNWLVGYPN